MKSITVQDIPAYCTVPYGYRYITFTDLFALSDLIIFYLYHCMSAAGNVLLVLVRITGCSNQCMVCHGNLNAV
jgi:hypothetical protein